MKKWFCLILMFGLFLIGETRVFAKSATYVYEIKNTTITVKIDNLGNISYSKSGNGLVSSDLSGLESDQFMDSKGNFLKPSSDKIKTIYVVLDLANSTGENSSNMKYKLAFDKNSFGNDKIYSTKYTINTSLSKVDNKTTSGEKTIELTCPYYYNDTHANIHVVAKYYSGKTVVSTATGYNVSPGTETVSQTPEKCPKNIYVKYIDENNIFVSVTKSYSDFGVAKYEGVNKNDSYYTGTGDDDSEGDPTKVLLPGQVEKINICEEGKVLLVFQVIGYIIFVAKIIIPLLLIIMGSIDLARAMVDSDQKALKDSIVKLIKRFIAGVIIFFLPTIFNFIFSLVDGAVDNQKDFSGCTKCVFDPLGNCGAKKIVNE